MTDHQTKADHPVGAPPAKPKRRRFSDEYKLRILEEADRCTGSGELGLLLRREGLYSSSIATWRRWRRQQLPEHPESQKPATESQLRHEVARLKRDKARLQIKLDHAEKIAALQKKFAEMIETMETEPTGEPSP